MITGRNVWEKAGMDDRSFEYYVRSSHPEREGKFGFKPKADFFSMIFDVTEETNDLLKAIFTINPDNRISLSEMQKRISAIKSFGSGKVRPKFARPDSPVDSLAVSDERYISNDASTATHIPTSSIMQVSKDCSVKAQLRASGSILPTLSASSEDIGTEGSPLQPNGDSSHALCVQSSTNTLKDSNRKTTRSSQSDASGDSDESGEDSDGPETPKTHATDDTITAERDIETIDLASPGTSDRDWATVSETWTPTTPHTEKQPIEVSFGLIQIDLEGTHIV